MTKVKNDPTFDLGYALSFVSDAVSVVRLPRKPKKKAKRHQIAHTAQGALWCGPAAVSAITGVDTKTIHDMIRKYRRKPRSRVTGTNAAELEYVLNKLGYTLEHTHMFGGRNLSLRPTFEDWIKATNEERPEGLAYLIGLRRKDDPKEDAHWCVIFDDKYICSIQPRWISARRAMFKERHVDFVFAVRKL